MLFSPENSAKNIKLGYYDSLRFIKGLRGVLYYIQPVDAGLFDVKALSLRDKVILEAGKILGVPEMPARRMLFEEIIPQLSKYLKLGKDYDYADFIIALLESEAEQKKIERFHIYKYDKLWALVRKTPEPRKKGLPLPISPLNKIINKKKAATQLLSREAVYAKP
jgi:NTE family protein